MNKSIPAQIWLIISIICGLVRVSWALDTRQKIAVIDTGINITKEVKPYLCDSGHRSFTGYKWDTDESGHGTNVAGLIAKHLDPTKHCLLVLKYYTPDEKAYSQEQQAIKYAISQHVKFINLSLGGPGAYITEYNLIKSVVSKHINISVAAGNDAQNLDTTCNNYPACYVRNLDPNRFHVVGNLASKGSNYGKIVKYWENGTNVGSPMMTGSSQATAIHTGKWANDER